MWLSAVCYVAMFIPFVNFQMNTREIISLGKCQQWYANWIRAQCKYSISSIILSPKHSTERSHRIRVTGTSNKVLASLRASILFQFSLDLVMSEIGPSHPKWHKILSMYITAYTVYVAVWQHTNFSRLFKLNDVPTVMRKKIQGKEIKAQRWAKMSTNSIIDTVFRSNESKYCQMVVANG